MSLIIGDNFSYLGAKPLDGRLSYTTISAMTGMAASSLYDGIMAFCAETGKEYQWKSANTEDPTLGKWREFTSGGGAALTIKDDGTAVTERDTVNFTDFDIDDDSTNEETDITPHRLTAGEMTEIMSTLPGTPVDLPVMWDDTGTEYQIGWYKLSNGKKIPIYRKTLYNAITLDSTSKQMTAAHNIPNIGRILRTDGYATRPTDNKTWSIPQGFEDGYYYLAGADATNVGISRKEPVGWSGFNVTFSIIYTKTTDTPID